MKTRLSFIPRWVMGMTLLALTCGALAQTTSTAETAPPKLTLTCRDAYCLITTAETQVTLSVSGKHATPGDYQLKYQLAGWDGETLNQESLTLQLPGEFNQDLGFALARYGSYTLTASLTDPQGQEVASGKLRLVRPVPVPVLTRAQRRNSSIGANVHLHAKWDALAKMGIHWARDYASGWLAKSENLPFGDKSVPHINFKEMYDYADEQGVTVLPCIQQGFRTPDLKYFISDTDKIAAGYERLSKAFPEIEFWELDNEIDLQHHGNPLEFEKFFESYVACIQAANDGLTRAGHGAKVVLNGDAGINYERTQRLLGLVGDDFAVSNFHFYTGTIPPEISRTDFNTNAENLLGASGFLDRMRAFSKLAHDNGKQAWLTEIGWDETNGPAVGERLQTLFLARMFLLARYCNVDKTFWFFDRDTNGTGIFSTCGLLNNDGNVRPIAASMAAVSKYTALADYIGSVDIGDDRWCLIFDDQGKWVVPVWSVHGEYALPEPLANAEMVDVFGNPVEPARAKITPSVLYTFPQEIPDAWQQQTQAKWITDFGMVSFPGGSYDIKVELPENAKLVWNNLPAGVSIEAVDTLQRIRVFSLTCSPEMPLGEYAFSATASGEGWQKNWALDLRIIPPLQIRSEAYLPGEKSAVHLKTNAGQAQVDLNVLSRLGVVQPDSVKVSTSEEATVEFQADENATGPVKLTAKLATGAEQIAWLRPKRLNVPLLENMTLDGNLTDWPSEARLTSQAMALNSLEFDPTVYLGWGDDGLYLAARIPVRKIEAGRPDHFWDFPAVELFFNPSEQDPGEAWPITARQFFFTAVQKDDQWSVNVGQWKRNEAIPETIFTQAGAKTGIHIGEKEIVMEIFLPKELLGAAPKENDIWKVAVTVQDATREEYHLEGDWPNFKNPYILDGVKGWGQMRFSPLIKVSRWEPNIQKFEERDRRNFR